MNLKKISFQFSIASFVVLTLFAYQNCSVEAIHELGEASGSSTNSVTDTLAEGERIEINTELEQKALAIISSRCISCHNDFTAKFDVNVEGDTLELMDKGLIIAGLPEGSLLYKSMISSSRQTDGVSPMPPNSPLADSETAVIKDWIENGISIIKANNGENGEAEITYNYEEHIQPILQKNLCLDCHSEGISSNASMGGYILLDSYERLMNFVQIGNSYSLILDSIRQGNMPKNSEPMSDEDFNVLESWVNQGALEKAVED
ncbi:MAG: hypothetical protein VX642_06670 [Bdellovibrionota bacterium]|nr:hypothetical protein [Bdellovibrionota bacterium]